MRQEWRERFLHHRGLTILTCIMAHAWRTYRDACRFRQLAVSFFISRNPWLSIFPRAVWWTAFKCLHKCVLRWPSKQVLYRSIDLCDMSDCDMRTHIRMQIKWCLWKQYFAAIVCHNMIWQLVIGSQMVESMNCINWPPRSEIGMWTGLEV